MKNLSLARVTIFIILIAALYSPSFAQNGEIRISPKAVVGQTIGLTDVLIEYNRPGVKGRTIWGGLVPYDAVWRAGANEATKITFKSGVIINGKKLKAGSYGFFAIPTKNKWVLIFNKVADQWGAFEYNEAEDVLRIESTPDQGSFQEWLAYTITKTGDKSSVVKLEWDKLKVPFSVEVE